MQNREVEDAILNCLYQAWPGPDENNALDSLKQEKGWDENTFERVINRMEYDSLIRPVGLSYEITAPGIVEAEKRHCVPQKIAEENIKVRDMILESLFNLYEEEGPDRAAHYEHLAKQHNLDPILTLEHALMLEEMVLLKEDGVGFFNLTYHALDKMHARKQWRALQEEFERVSIMEAHLRCLAFQKLFGKIIEQQGWTHRGSVRTSNEEMDIVVSQGREYYVIECKWLKDPVGAEVVRELLGKLTSRTDAKGIVVSMSGFTKGAGKEVERSVGNRVVLLFGPGDVLALVSGSLWFDDLLTEKYNSIVIDQKAIYR